MKPQSTLFSFHWSYVGDVDTNIISRNYKLEEQIGHILRPNIKACARTHTHTIKKIGLLFLACTTSIVQCIYKLNIIYAFHVCQRNIALYARGFNDCVKINVNQ